MVIVLNPGYSKSNSFIESGLSPPLNGNDPAPMMEEKKCPFPPQFSQVGKDNFISQNCGYSRKSYWSLRAIKTRI